MSTASAAPAGRARSGDTFMIVTPADGRERSTRCCKLIGKSARRGGARPRLERGQADGARGPRRRARAPRAQRRPAARPRRPSPPSEPSAADGRRRADAASRRRAVKPRRRSAAPSAPAAQRARAADPSRRRAAERRARPRARTQTRARAASANATPKPERASRDDDDAPTCVGFGADTPGLPAARRRAATSRIVGFRRAIVDVRSGALTASLSSSQPSCRPI